MTLITCWHLLSSYIYDQQLHFVWLHYRPLMKLLQRGDIELFPAGICIVDVNLDSSHSSSFPPAKEAWHFACIRFVNIGTLVHLLPIILSLTNPIYFVDPNCLYLFPSSFPLYTKSILLNRDDRVHLVRILNIMFNRWLISPSLWCHYNEGRCWRISSKC